MRLHRSFVASACLTPLALVAAVANGCVSSTSTTPPGEDAGFDFDANTGPGADSSTGSDSSPGADSATLDSGPGLDATQPTDSGPTNDATQSDTGPGLDATPPPDVFDAGVDAGPIAKIRVAWLDDPSYVNIQRPPNGVVVRYDACVAPHGTNAWQGPLMHAAGGLGVALFDVSMYFDVPAAQYDVRIVPGGSATCDLPDGGSDAGFAQTDFTSLPPLTANTRLTFAVAPDWAAPNPGSIVAHPLLDEAAATPGKVKVRFANTSNLSSFDYGLGGGDVFTPLFTGVSNQSVIAVADADAGTNLGVDANGYLELDPFTQIDSTVRSGGADYGSTPSIDAPAGTVLSAFATYSSGVGQGLLVCYDSQPSASSPLLTKCVQVTAGSPPVLRFVNLISDAATNIDFCVKYHSMASYGSAHVGQSGTPFASGSERYAVHGQGFTYDVRVVSANVSGCATGLAPDVQFVSPADPLLLSTMVFTGSLAALDGGGGAIDAGGDGGGLASTAFAAVTVDDARCVSTETNPVARVYNFASAKGTAQTVSLNGTTSWSMSNIPYGAAGTTTGVDACGYLPFTAVTNGTLQTQGGTWNYTNTVRTDTLYLYSASPTSVHVLSCDDRNATLSACAILPLGG